MLVVPYVLVGPTQLTNASATIFTTPTNGRYVITRAVFTNVAVTSQTLTVNIGRAGAAAASTNLIISAYTISAGEIYVAPGLVGLVLNATDKVYANSDVISAINVVISGFATQ